ncbi:related to 6-hydroxy-D-nicotine oxidase [Phialocephala subalpina]|uniref:Related to 6-hydroxy-D-nicotine oxidase n=1 Tax=Phialocephala subalpina TaxID=576137 RepID=A0A1L7WK11_9HELO|nr:related to 6-hydroxy-D-nicotine oxidase [Phialocephala subalpina]
MGSVGNQKLSELEAFLKEHPHIPFATPSSPKYAALKEIFILDCKANPLIIVRPQTAADVSLLVKHAKAQGIKFVIRTGGHSLFGASSIDGAMTIDMRDIVYVNVEDGNKTAKVGGGILQGELATKLFEEGLATPIGTIPSVGYVGWAAYGGYGHLSAHFGLGVDQIVGAMIVDPSGNITDADEKLLRGIKGAGGIFGVIVEVTVRVLAGSLIFESSDISAAFKKLNIGYRELSAQGLPSELVVQQMIVNSPYGIALVFGFTWSSEDIETGRAWLSKCEALGTIVMNTVAETTLPDMLREAQAMVPLAVHGSIRTHSLRAMTEEVTAAVSPFLEKLPSDPGTMFVVHELRGPSAKPTKESVFGSREPHFMLEIIGCTLKQEARDASVEWSGSMWEALDKTDRKNILPETYISLDPPGESPGQTPLAKIFGSHDTDVVALKQEYDATNVFDLAIPRLVNYSVS